MANSTEAPPTVCCSVTPTQRTIFLMIDVVLFLAITIGNTLVLLSVAIYSRLQTPTNRFLASLAVADLFVSLVCLPTDALIGLGLIPTVSPWVCAVGSSMTTLAITVSLTHLTVVAFDRFIAITKPLKYLQQMTPRAVNLLIAASWTLCLIFSLLPFFGWNQIRDYDFGYCDLLFIHVFSYRLTGILLMAFVPVMLVGYVYFKIFQVARQHSKRIAAENRIFNRHGERSLSRDLKAAKTLAVVLGTFLVAVTPAAVISVADVMFPVSDLFLYKIICYHILYANSAMNPITYAFRNKEFRLAFIKLLAKLFRCKRWQDMARKATRSLVDQTLPSQDQISRHEAAPSVTETK